MIILKCSNIRTHYEMFSKCHNSLCYLTPLFTKRCFVTSNYLSKNLRSGVIKAISRRLQPLTYEQAKYPEHIGILKSWNSWNTTNLYQEKLHLKTIVWQDAVIRKLLHGVFSQKIHSEVK